VRVLSRLFRRLVLEKLAAAHAAGELQFFGNHAPLTDAKAFAAYLAPLRNSEWVVYSKRPFVKAASCNANEPQTPKHPCPCCGGPMIIIETFQRGCSPRYRPMAPVPAIRIDTS
jgi:hypothetical protein